MDGDKKNTPTKPMSTLVLNTSSTENGDASPIMRRLEKKRGSKPNPFETKVKLDDVRQICCITLLKGVIIVNFRFCLLNNSHWSEI